MINYVEFIKKNIIFTLNLLIGIFIIHKSVDFGRDYFVNFITINQLSNFGYSNIFMSMSILKYIIIGVILSIFGILRIKK